MRILGPMQQLVSHLSPDNRIERLVGLERFKSEVERRGYTAITHAGHTAIFFKNDPIPRL